MAFLGIFVCLVALLIKITTASHREKYNFELVHQWKQIEYKFSSEQERSKAIANGSFNVGKIVPADAQYTYEGKRFFCDLFMDI